MLLNSKFNALLFLICIFVILACGSSPVFIPAPTNQPGNTMLYVEILSGDEVVYSGDQTVILDGEAYTDSGDLPGIIFTWNSDIDGQLGTGDELVINAQNLTEGTHKITLIAHHNALQATGSDTITLKIYRNFSSLSVDTESLNFAAQLGDIRTEGQVVEIWHLGNHSVKWSAAADQEWIQLNAIQGQGELAESETPSDLAVFVDPNGLSVGTYTGTITITSNAEGINTHTIQVTFEIK